MTTRVAYVAELAEPSDAGRFTGRFGAHWEGPGESWGAGPEGVDLGAAIAWARSQAQVVFVSIGGEGVTYSAGVRHPDVSVPRWPNDGVDVRPRPEGTPYDGSVQVAAWSVEAHVAVEPAHEADEVAKTVRSALKGVGSVSAVVVRHDAQNDVWVSCTVEAPGRTSAVRVVEGAIHRMDPEVASKGLRVQSGTW